MAIFRGMRIRLIFIIYISYFVGLFLYAVMWLLVETGVNRSGDNIPSIAGRGCLNTIPHEMW